MIAPALIFVAVNLGQPENLRGWAIPSATDIAFALGVLALLGPRVPVSLKVFLTAVAIVDDLGAIAIIAAFYTADLSVLWLSLAPLMLVVLSVFNWLGVTRLAPYCLIGLVLWFFVLHSGVHATLAGVALAFTIPLRTGTQPHHSEPLLRLEHALQPWVAYLVVPVFGFANAGVSFDGLTWAALAAPLPLGIILGLFLGKQVGVFGAVWIAVRMRWAQRPEGASMPQVYGVALICGIGFTMSLFIGLLAFPSSAQAQDAVKIGVLAGSLVSAIAGALVLRLSSPTRS
jgi:Na+:H+ antiporter, NhaA family